MDFSVSLSKRMIICKTSGYTFFRCESSFLSIEVSYERYVSGVSVTQIIKIYEITEEFL